MTVEPLTFGISLPNRAVLFGLAPETLLETACQAEASGAFDSVWVGDNFLSKPRLEALVTLGAVAGRTRRVKLGTVCLASFPFRHPVELALQWASLDRLSGGRTILAVCAGGPASRGPQFAAELKAMGVQSTERVGRMEEGIELLRQFWGQARVTYAGRYYAFEGVDVQPKPLQTRVPVVIAVNPAPEAAGDVVERALRRVARLGDGWQTDGTPPEVFGDRWTRIRAYAAEYGRADEVRHASLHLMVNINDDAATARRESVAFLSHYYGEGAIAEEKLESWLAFGSPSAVVDKVQQFVEAGCTTPILRFTSPDQRGQLERCLEDVLPAFSARAARVVETVPAGHA